MVRRTQVVLALLASVKRVPPRPVHAHLQKPAAQLLQQGRASGASPIRRRGPRSRGRAGLRGRLGPSKPCCWRQRPALDCPKEAGTERVSPGSQNAAQAQHLAAGSSLPPVRLRHGRQPHGGPVQQQHNPGLSGRVLQEVGAAFERPGKEAPLPLSLLDTVLGQMGQAFR